MNAIEIVREALAEDERENGHFDAEGFSNFCPEEDPADITAAWLIYDNIVYGGQSFAHEIIKFHLANANALQAE